MSTREKPPRKPRSRAARIRLVILLSILGAALAYTGRRMMLPPMQLFTEDFDSSIGTVEPAMVQVMAADPALHRQIIRSAKEAFDAGNWNYATRRVEQLKWQLMQAYAPDADILACAAAHLQLTRALLKDRPGLCRQYVQMQEFDDAWVGLPSVPFRAPCDRAVIDGNAARVAGTAPRLMPDAAYDAAVTQTYAGPNQLSDDEQKAIFSDTGDDLKLLCQAGIKLQENQLALPDAAAFLRTQRAKALPTEPDSIKTPGPAAAGRGCAPAGTIFTLSMEKYPDGAPITWTSLGPDRWDCRTESSASGKRGLFGDADFTPLHLLWPLAVGKTAQYSLGYAGTDMESHVLRVESFARYWLATGWTWAFAISQTVRVNGVARYVITHYWSPELGFKIGQHTEVLVGDWPNDTAPDWQVIDVRRPAKK